jgi:hypothetical protein
VIAKRNATVAIASIHIIASQKGLFVNRQSCTTRQKQVNYAPIRQIHQGYPHFLTPGQLQPTDVKCNRKYALWVKTD